MGSTQQEPQGNVASGILSVHLQPCSLQIILLESGTSSIYLQGLHVCKIGMRRLLIVRSLCCTGCKLS